MAIAPCGLLLLVLAAAPTASFNFAVDSALVFGDPQNDSSSYFGFSVALHAGGGGSGAQIIVGAPRAKSWISHASTQHPGLVYVCPSHHPGKCKPLFTERTGANISEVHGNTEYGNTGFAVDAEHSSNVVVACGPTWKSERDCFNSYEIPSRPNGICYWTAVTSDSSERVIGIHPLTNCDSQIIDDYYFAFGEFGASMIIVQNSSEIIVGAPGVQQWKGAVLRYKFKSSNTDCTCLSSYLSSSMRENIYLGYSTSYGRFTAKGDISYVSGAPRAAGNKGKIFVFNFENNWTVLKEREGTQFGEYFGASLCVGDFNADGLDDLLVGAPQHSLEESAGDEGGVYILISTKNGWRDLGIISGSQKMGARFGTSMALLGDINMDGYIDAAIGAPYENNRGAIYIYHGTKLGLNVKFIQRITPSGSSNLYGFGYSISRGLDVDGNQINDIAVGSFISGHVVLLKSYPIVSIISKLKPQNKTIPFGAQNFERELCFLYLEKYVSVSVEVEVSIKVDQHYRRAFFKATNETQLIKYNVTLKNSNPECQNLYLIIKNPSEFSHPIEFFVEYRIVSPTPGWNRESNLLKEVTRDKFCRKCVVRNPSEPQHFKYMVPYEPDPVPADLHINANFINVMIPYTIGSKKSIEFEVILINKNEKAIEPKISVLVPLKMVRIPPLCQMKGDFGRFDDTSELICDVPSPLREGIKFSINFTLSTTLMRLDVSELKIHIETHSRSLESNYSDNLVDLILPLRRVYQLEINGRSEEYAVITDKNKLNTDEEEEETTQKLYKHSYNVMNYGPSPATDLKLYVEIPHKVKVMGIPIEVVNIEEYAAYLEEQPLLCMPHTNFSISDYKESSDYEEIQLPANRTFVLSCSSYLVQCMKFQCSVNYLDAKSYGLHVSFILKVNSKKLAIPMGLKDIILLKTFGHIISRYNIHAEVHSVIWTSLPDTSLDYSILAMSVGFGCLILLICLLLLIKLGFFRRQDAIERYYRKKTAIALETNNVPASRFFSPRGSIMVF